MQKRAVAHRRSVQHRQTSNQARGDGDDHLVHQTSLDKARDHLAAAFHHDAPDAALAELMEQMRQIDPALAVMAAADDLSAPAFDRADSLVIAFVGTGQPASLVGTFKETGLQRYAQIAVKDDGLGARSLGETNGEQGIVDQQGVDADDNGVAGGADAMGDDHGLVAAQSKLFSIPGGDAAIHALGVGNSDQRSMMLAPGIVRTGAVTDRTIVPGRCCIHCCRRCWGRGGHDAA